MRWVQWRLEVLVPWVHACITNANGIFLALATLVISVGKLGDATSLTARVGEELKMQGVFFHEHRWLVLYTSALTFWRLNEGYQAFEGYCDARQEFPVGAFSTRGIDHKGASIFEKAIWGEKTHFDETVAICEGAR